jgi:type IV secretory pathway VirB3-like protein
MAKLKRTTLFAAASRQPVIPGVGLPLSVALSLFVAIAITMVFFRGWRSWLVLFALWGVLGVAARFRVQRDRNAFRVDALWLKSKAFFMDSVMWRGVTLRSFPPRQDRFRPRGIVR